MKSLLIVLFAVFIFIYSCANPNHKNHITNSNQDSKNKRDSCGNVEQNQKTLIEEFLQFRNSIDSSYNNCVSKINPKNSNISQEDYILIVQNIEETIVFIKLKIKEFEKIEISEEDANCKTMMLELLVNYSQLLEIDYPNIIELAIKQEDLTKEEYDEYKNLFNVLNAKRERMEDLYQKILLHYDSIHDKA